MVWAGNGPGIHDGMQHFSVRCKCLHIHQNVKLIFLIFLPIAPSYELHLRPSPIGLVNAELRLNLQKSLFAHREM